jgi:ribonuclease HI
MRNFRAEMMMEKVEVYFDGGIRPHPNGGFAKCYGWVIKRDGQVTEGKAMAIDENNVGSCAVEFDALILALRDVAQYAGEEKEIEIHGDSRAVIDMCSGRGKPHSDMLYEKHLIVSELASQLNNLSFSWVPRELNTVADRLGRDAFAANTQQEDRISLMNKINIQARRYFGDLYDAAIMAAWCITVTGKRKLANMSIEELGRLLRNACNIPRMISEAQVA